MQFCEGPSRGEQQIARHAHSATKTTSSGKLWIPLCSHEVSISPHFTDKYRQLVWSCWQKHTLHLDCILNSTVQHLNIFYILLVPHNYRLCVCVCTQARMPAFTFSCEYQCSHPSDDKCGLDGHILWHAQAAIFPQVQFLPTFYNLLLNVKTFVSHKLLPAIYLLFSQDFFRNFLRLSALQCNCNMTTFPASLSFLYSFGLFILRCFNSSPLCCIKMIALLITHTSPNLFCLLEAAPFLNTHTGQLRKNNDILRFYTCPVEF